MNQSCTTTRYVGLDVHKRQITVCILDPQGKVLLRAQVPTRPEAITSFATRHLQPTDQVALEATTNCWAVAELLQGHVANVVISNPLLTKAIATAKVKTDKIDARVLADLLRCHYLPAVWHPDKATRRLRALTHRRAGLSADRTAIKNRIHATLAMHLIQAPVPDLFSPKGLDWLRELAADPATDPDLRMAIASDLRLLGAVQAELDALEEHLAGLGYSDQRVKLLMSLPGVDYPTALTLLAAWGRPERFPDAAHAASYLGLTPSTHQSDSHCYHGPITKRGNRHARWMLVQAAQHAVRNPGPLGLFYRRLAHKKGHNLAVVATAHKLAVIAWHMLMTNQPYHYALPLPTQTKLARLRIKATGLRRRSGCPKGLKAASRLAGGGRSRTVPALDTVYAAEGLPAMHPTKPAQQRVLCQTGLDAFARALRQSHIKTRGRTQANTTPTP